MKRILVTTIALVMSIVMTAQENESTNTMKAQEDGVLKKRHIIKTNLTSLAFRNYQLSYEFAVAKWFSLNASYQMMPEGDIPYIDRWDEDLKISKTTLNHDNAQMKGHTLTFEGRLYMGKGYGKGFYLAPYYRNSSYEIQDLVLEIPVTDAVTGVSESVPVSFGGELTANSVGLLMGAQFFLGKSESFVIDFWFLGAHYGSASGDIVGVSPITLTADQQQQISEEIENYDIPFLDYTHEVDENGATFEVDGPWAGLRFGLGFGFRF